MTVALEGSEWSAARPGRTLPPAKSRYPLYRRLGVPQGRSGRAENLVPTGIRSQTAQPVVSRYTDWATRPTYMTEYVYKIPDYLMCNLQLHNSHLRTHTYIKNVDPNYVHILYWVQRYLELLCWQCYMF